VTTPLSDRIIARLQRDQVATVGESSKTTLGFKAAGLTLERSWQGSGRAAPTTSRDTIAEILHDNTHVTGVLITVDEIHDAPTVEVKAFANEFQHLLRDGLRVAFVGAGLPIGSLSDPQQIPTFLGRSQIPDLSYVADNEIADAFMRSLDGTGHTFTPDGLERATDAAAGLPYALQLIGWNLIGAATGKAFDAHAVDNILPTVHSSLLSGLGLPMSIPPGQLKFLSAMAHDQGPAASATSPGDSTATHNSSRPKEPDSSTMAT